jgi:hypothetical protein
VLTGPGDASRGIDHEDDPKMIHPLILHGYGLIEAPFDLTADRFGSHKRADASQMSVVATTSDPAEALDYLSLRTHPETRLVLLDRGGWTAVLTNARSGSDFNNHQYWAARTLGVRTIRVVDSDARWWKRGKLRERLAWEARMFELHAPDDSTIRTVDCADDGGRWTFHTIGDPFPIEESFAYDAPRKKDRFTRQNLHDLLAAVGPRALAETEFFATSRFALLAERITNDAWRERVEADACTLEQAEDPASGYYRRGMGWVPHMATHATSVIHDFERAIEINPDYEPRVRGYLRTARKVAGS